MTPQGSPPGAADPIVERAKRVTTPDGWTDANPSVRAFAEWIVRWSDTVAAARALNDLHSTTGIKTTIAPMPGGAECYCRVCTAVRSALPRDEKEGG